MAEEGQQAGDGARASSPFSLRLGAWGEALKRAATGLQRDNLLDWAATLTYYGVLSIFPALLAIVSIAGVIGASAVDPLRENINELAPGPAQEIADSALANLSGSRGAAGLTLVVSLAVALWSASAYVAAFMRASNALYDIEEGRPIWKTLPIRLAVTVALLVLLIAAGIGVTLTGGLAERVAEPLGLGDTALAAWEVAKWPAVLLAVGAILSLLYWASPNAEQPGFRWLAPGGILAVVLWLLASAAFAFYVASFGSYNETYGAMAAPIVFLIWLWISNIAVLLGAELNAELQRSAGLTRAPRDAP